MNQRFVQIISHTIHNHFGEVYFFHYLHNQGFQELSNEHFGNIHTCSYEMQIHQQKNKSLESSVFNEFVATDKLNSKHLFSSASSGVCFCLEFTPSYSMFTLCLRFPKDNFGFSVNDSTAHYDFSVFFLKSITEPLSVNILLLLHVQDMRKRKKSTRYLYDILFYVIFPIP